MCMTMKNQVFTEKRTPTAQSTRARGGTLSLTVGVATRAVRRDASRAGRRLRRDNRRQARALVLRRESRNAHALAYNVLLTATSVLECRKSWASYCLLGWQLGPGNLGASGGDDPSSYAFGPGVAETKPKRVLHLHAIICVRVSLKAHGS